jgi:hypothetical protein
MKMDHALRLAAGQAPGAEEILSMAGRLSGQGALSPGAAPAEPPPRFPTAAPDNRTTLRACQSLLSRTITLLE